MQENDILFVDSTHTVKIGEDVVYLYLGVLPRLNKDVPIHSYDIFLPKEYPKDWFLREHRFWNEQYLLQASLMFNDSFEIIWSSSSISLKRQEKLERTFRSTRKTKRFLVAFGLEE